MKVLNVCWFRLLLRWEIFRRSFAIERHSLSSIRIEGHTGDEIAFPANFQQLAAFRRCGNCEQVRTRVPPRQPDFASGLFLFALFLPQDCKGIYPHGLCCWRQRSCNSHQQQQHRGRQRRKYIGGFNVV